MVAKMTSEAETRINLTALKRRDPYISNIIDSATQVAVYTFNHNSGEWEKTEVEGTLFVYSRVAAPFEGFTIMNRLSMENLTEPLTSDIEFQNQSPFLLYRNAKFNIYGIWFYDQYDCTRIGKLLADKCNEAKQGDKNPIANSEALQHQPSPNSLGSSAASSTSDPVIEDDLHFSPEREEEANGAQKVGQKQENNLMGLLMKAKDDYNKTHCTADNLKNNQENENPDPLSQLFQPIKSDKSKKVNVATLFESKEGAKNVPRPSSAEIFAKILPMNGNSVPAQSQRRTSRSLSLSLGPTQAPPFYDTPTPPTMVNGAISVEELESPVLGMSLNGRTRYHSMSEQSSHKNASPKPTAECDSAFNKLLSKMAVTTTTGMSTSAHATEVKGNSVVNLLKANGGQQQGHVPQKFVQRQVSMPSGTVSSVPVPNRHNPTSLKQFSSSPSASFSASSNLPPVLEQSSSKTMGHKSLSVASGLAHLNNAPSPLRVSALHGTTATSELKLLSPDVLRSSVNDDQSIASSLGFPTKVPSHILNPSAESSSTQNPNLPNASNGKSSGDASKVVTLISPEDFEHCSNTPQKANELRQRLLPDVAIANSAPKSESKLPMTQQQLADTLITLLQTDDSFVAAIHNAYISGLNHASKEQPTSHNNWK